MSKYQLQLKPNPGQWLLYVDLEEIKSKSVIQVLTLLEQMGYDPQLRYLETDRGVKLYALLKEEQHEPTQSISDEHGFGELIALYEAFKDEDMAIRSSRGLPIKAPVTA
ncbi:MAG: hypothetical protein KME17_22190 [Cyanosarcina radialis HA8281-LM2]|jgi:hypothetical protein|nr:hypothetical protein [Cyanosarcina radialis HA8281-LM2]